MSTRKINPRIEPSQNIGLDAETSHLAERFINRDGSFNLQKKGLPFWQHISIYSYLLEISWLKFFALIGAFYTVVNILFTASYVLAWLDELEGFVSPDRWSQLKETFFFSMQTFTTVGYGRVNPVGDGSHIISSAEAFAGWIFFALITGLIYGRFTHPKAYLAFSENLLVAPYKGGQALMFRVVPYKNIHQLSDAKATMTLLLLVSHRGKEEYAFYPLKLERENIDIFNMHWTIVHPINEDSPVHNFNLDDFRNADFELMVQISGHDSVYSNQVMQRSSYTIKELVWGARFVNLYHQSKDGKTAVLDLEKLNWYEPAVLHSS